MMIGGGAQVLRVLEMHEAKVVRVIETVAGVVIEMRLSIVLMRIQMAV